MTASLTELNPIFKEAYTLCSTLTENKADNIWRASLIQAAAHIDAAWQYYYMYFNI